MKKALSLMLIVVMLCASLCACSGNGGQASGDDTLTGFLESTDSVGHELNAELTVIDMTGIELGCDKGFHIISGDVKLVGTFKVTNYKIEFGADCGTSANIDLSELHFDVSSMEVSTLDHEKNIISVGSYETELSVVSPSDLPTQIQIVEPDHRYSICAVTGLRETPRQNDTQHDANAQEYKNLMAESHKLHWNVDR